MHFCRFAKKVCNIIYICVYQFLFLFNFLTSIIMAKENRKKYAFNELLLKHLTDVLDTTSQGLAKAAGIPSSTFRYWRRTGNIPIRALINICNEYMIPIGYFIIVDGSPVVLMGRKDYMQTNGRYQMATFLAKEWGDEVTVMMGNTIDYVCGLCGIGPNSFYSYFRNGNEDKSSLTICNWINYCNALKVYPMDYFTASSVKVPLLQSYQRRSCGMNNRIPFLEQKLKELDAQNKRLLGRVRILREEVKRLRAEKGIDSGYGMVAAEDSVSEYKEGK